MRVLFVDCGLMMLFCVCTNRNICLVRIGVSIEPASPGAFTSIDFNLPAELGKGRRDSWTRIVISFTHISSFTNDRLLLESKIISLTVGT